MHAGGVAAAVPALLALHGRWAVPCCCPCHPEAATAAHRLRSSRLPAQLRRWQQQHGAPQRPHGMQRRACAAEGWAALMSLGWCRLATMRMRRGAGACCLHNSCRCCYSPRAASTTDGRAGAQMHLSVVAKPGQTPALTRRPGGKRGCPGDKGGVEPGTGIVHALASFRCQLQSRMQNIHLPLSCSVSFRRHKGRDIAPRSTHLPRV